VEAGGLLKPLLGRDVEMRGTGDVFARADAPAKAKAISQEGIHSQIADGFNGCKEAIAKLEKAKKPGLKVAKNGADATITHFPPICAEEARQVKPKDPSFVINVSETEIKLHNAPQSLLDKLD
jgi:hypothetical protein